MQNRLFLASFLTISLATPALAAPLPKPPVFGVCGACHKVDKGAPNGIGPNLWGIGNTKAGDVPGFAFSPAMKASKIKWNRDNLIAFIQDPRKTVPGNRMPFAGLKNPASAAQIADYILSLK
ncbi:c-type cytochrome [Rhizorhabdus dicambivorans]|uniref:Cytochrome C n=1 Tax=Rhizorhabdus dicambivorans TaxID=1850238 RepID=A0A2A4FP07_9SPHN|nr:c-type cytochrome [Rhizorhabdus dicambivorans]ATE67025.1 cytochrome C [Rhizorhabdus dicambivorans]PCE40495.1 cytochrome C [Rhizorhabdus dicambivorans]